MFKPMWVEVSVEDRGIGIPKEEQQAIFQSFYRAKNVDNIQGTGVGLSVVSEFVKLHKGKIRVKSKATEGSTFTVTIPFK
jgi:signal transduction histidine kinase